MNDEKTLSIFVPRKDFDIFTETCEQLFDDEQTKEQCLIQGYRFLINNLYSFPRMNGLTLLIDKKNGENKAKRRRVSYHLFKK